MGRKKLSFGDGSQIATDQAAGAPEFRALRAKGEGHPIEAVGREVRSMFAWRAELDKDYTEGSVAR